MSEGTGVVNVDQSMPMSADSGRTKLDSSLMWLRRAAVSGGVAVVSASTAIGSAAVGSALLLSYAVEVGAREMEAAHDRGAMPDPSRHEALGSALSKMCALAGGVLNQAGERLIGLSASADAGVEGVSAMNDTGRRGNHRAHHAMTHRNVANS
jgi:hypothetical protein